MVSKNEILMHFVEAGHVPESQSFWSNKVEMENETKVDSIQQESHFCVYQWPRIWHTSIKSSVVSSSFGPWRLGWAASWRDTSASSRQFPSPCPGQGFPSCSSTHQKTGI